MKIVIGLLRAVGFICLIAAYESLPSEQHPLIICPCQYRYDPVCGSNGVTNVTYMNKCVFDCISRAHRALDSRPIKLVEEHECSGNCNCQNVDLPVCTLDGQTYPNECVLACENINKIENQQPITYLAYRTSCRGLPGTCTEIAAPVCGTDNVLYRNKCVLDFVNTYNSEQGLPSLTVKNNGACTDSYLCPITRQPICASDGYIYNNPCELEAENERRRCYKKSIFLSEADWSLCKECRCAKYDDPICASDGNTYPNNCHLECEIQTQKNPDLRPLYRGKCRECNCKEEYQPVCGTDRKTYGSRCWLECENIGKNEKLPPLQVFHEGQCQEYECDCGHCDDAYQPMCGNDGKTYWNLCWLQCNDRCCQKNGKDAVFLSKRGAC